MYEGGDYIGWMFWDDVWYSVILAKQLIRQIIQAEPTSVQHIFYAVQTRREGISRLRPLQSDSDLMALVSQGRLDMVEIFFDNDWNDNLDDLSDFPDSDVESSALSGGSAS